MLANRRVYTTKAKSRMKTRSVSSLSKKKESPGEPLLEDESDSSDTSKPPKPDKTPIHGNKRVKGQSLKTILAFGAGILGGAFLTAVLVKCGYDLIPGLLSVCDNAWGREAVEPLADVNTVASPQEPAAQCTDSCTFSLVESIPENLTYNGTHTVHLSTYAALKTLMASAKTSIQIASYYWTLLGTDISYHDETSAEGEDIFHTLLNISNQTEIKLQIVQNAENNDTALLAKQGASIRTLNFSRLLGSGILHTKFWLVDGQHFYIGSANLDWRSYTQVKELGVLVQNCPCLGSDLQKIFDVYWFLGQSNVIVPHKWPPKYNTSINVTNPLTVPFNHTMAPVFISSSPPQFCPSGRTSDLDAIRYVISQAKQFVYISVMDYAPATLFMTDNTTGATETLKPSYWPEIDDALRTAAFNNHVHVRILASKWKHTNKDMYTYLCSLRLMAFLHFPNTSFEVGLFKVPSNSEQSKIPYTRVNHNKYMVTDQHAYIGTSNWSGDYFISTAGVGFVVQQPTSAAVNDTTDSNFRGQLQELFIRDWSSTYREHLVCNHY